MISTDAAARAWRRVGLLLCVSRTNKAVAGTGRRVPRPYGSELRVDARTALTAGFVAACTGLLAMIALRGYTIYG
jgi:hypothetical protein